MRPFSFCLLPLALFAALTAPLFAQNTQPELSARLAGKPLILKGFWSDDKLKFDESGRPSKRYATSTFTLAGFDADTVKVSGHALQITGVRMGLTWDAKGALMRVPLYVNKDKTPEKLAVEIDCHAACDFGTALDAIFAANLADIVPLLPDYWQRYAAVHFLPTADDSSSPHDVIIKGAYHVGGGITPPKILHSVDPEFSEVARRQKFSGNVMLYLWVEKDGTTSHLQIARPIGYGLDEKAIEAVAQYQFRPASKKNGDPVAVDLFIDVNFQIF